MRPGPTARGTVAAVTAGAMAALVGGCGSSDGPGSSRIVVDAAASLATSFPALGKEFERAHPGSTVTFNFGGSDQLAAQVDAGAPVDVFAAASPLTMATVTSHHENLTAPADFARNRVEIVAPAANPRHIRSLQDTVRPDVTLVLCAPTVPCGATAAEVYAAAGLTPHPKSQEPDVTAVLTKVQLGEAQAGIVYRTDVREAGPKVTGIPLPPSAQSVTSYQIAVTKHGRETDLGRQFVAFVRSRAGLRSLRAAGFLPP